MLIKNSITITSLIYHYRYFRTYLPRPLYYPQSLNSSLNNFSNRWEFCYFYFFYFLENSSKFYFYMYFTVKFLRLEWKLLPKKSKLYPSRAPPSANLILLHFSWNLRWVVFLEGDDFQHNREELWKMLYWLNSFIRFSKISFNHIIFLFLFIWGKYAIFCVENFIVNIVYDVLFFR